MEMKTLNSNFFLSLFSPLGKNHFSNYTRAHEAEQTTILSTAPLKIMFESFSSLHRFFMHSPNMSAFICSFFSLMFISGRKLHECKRACGRKVKEFNSNFGKRYENHSIIYFILANFRLVHILWGEIPLFTLSL